MHNAAKGFNAAQQKLDATQIRVEPNEEACAETRIADELNEKFISITRQD